MPTSSPFPSVSSPPPPEQTWARKSAKLLAAVALLATTAFAAKAEEVTNQEFVKVTNSTQIVSGGEYIFMNQPFKSGKVSYGTYVMGAVNSTNKGFDAISIDANATSVPETVMLTSDKAYTVVTLENAASEGSYNLKVGDKYISGSAKSTLCLKDEASSATITFNNEDCTVSVVTGTETVKNVTKDLKIQMYAKNSGGKAAGEVFNVYSSNQHPIYFYTPVPTAEIIGIPQEGNMEVDDEISFNCKENVNVWYKILTSDESKPAKEVGDDGYTKYENPIKVQLKHVGISYYTEHDLTKVKSTAKSADFTVSVKSGIASIEAENGEAVYFNLQGVRVQNPEKGIFIRVQNGKAVKIAK